MKKLSQHKLKYETRVVDDSSRLLSANSHFIGEFMHAFTFFISSLKMLSNIID
jgi:hypothetical protein